MPLPPLITSRTNAKVKALRASLSGEARTTGDLLGLEGLKLIGEVHKWNGSFDTVFVREGCEALLTQGWPQQIRTENWAVLSPEVFDGAVETRSPQGIAATWVIQPAEPKPLRGSYLLMEELQDPGNVGTLIRTAEAFGFGMMATHGTVNQWNPKVVRASAGSVLRTGILRGSIRMLYDELHGAGFRIFAAVAGIGQRTRMTLPHGAVLGRRDDAPGDGRWADQGVPSHPEGQAASLSPHVDFAHPCAIVVGNEGAGLSNEAVDLADEQISIPSNVESLNAGVAGSLLMYEEMRQRELREWARKQGMRS